MSIIYCEQCDKYIDTDYTTIEEHQADCEYKPTRQDEDGLADYNNLPADEK